MPRATPVRDRILDAANELVLRQGFSATTVDAVLDAASASKGAFFHHFPSKRALGHALVERYAAGDRVVLEEFMGIAESRTDDPAGQLVEFVRAFEDASDELALSQPGCLFVSFVYEQVPDTAEVRPLIIEAIEHWRRRIAGKLEILRAAGRLQDDVDVDSLADHVFTTFEGAFILARATGDTGHVRAQLGHLRRYLELLLGTAPPA
jgi:TetR/AcrR family transcriptional regulator, transcriptional repressor for nem operon